MLILLWLFYEQTTNHFPFGIVAPHYFCVPLSCVTVLVPAEGAGSQRGSFEPNSSCCLEQILKAEKPHPNRTPSCLSVGFATSAAVLCPGRPLQPRSPAQQPARSCLFL